MQSLEQAYERIKSSKPAQDRTGGVPSPQSVLDSGQAKLSLQDAYSALKDEPFEHDFSWKQMFANIPKDVINQWKDLRAAVTPEGASIIGNLLKEVGTGGKPINRLKMRAPTAYARLMETSPELAATETPTLDAIAQFYEDNYDLASAEGRERFQKYLEEHPVAVAADMIAIASMAGGGALVGASTKTLGATKYLKPIARAAEFAVDPGAAIGRTFGDIGKTIKFDDAFLEDMLVSAVADIEASGRKLSDTDLQKLYDAFSAGDIPIDDPWRKRPTFPKGYINAGKNFLRQHDLLKYIGFAAGAKIGDIEAAAIGYIVGTLGDKVANKLLGNNPRLIEYVIKQPYKFLKPASVGTGRATQRTGQQEQNMEETDAK